MKDDFINHFISNLSCLSKQENTDFALSVAADSLAQLSVDDIQEIKLKIIMEHPLYISIINEIVDLIDGHLALREILLDNSL